MYFGGHEPRSLETVRRSVTMNHAHRKADSCQVPMRTDATWSFFRTMGHKIGTPLWLSIRDDMGHPAYIEAEQQFRHHRHVLGLQAHHQQSEQDREE